MTSAYRNPWIPGEALNILTTETGRILDVGGGAAPYYRATHVLDIQPFDAERLSENAWGGDQKPEAGSLKRETGELRLERRADSYEQDKSGSELLVDSEPLSAIGEEQSKGV